MIDSINKRLEDIYDELIASVKEFEERHPADFLILETKEEEFKSSENRTN